MTSQERITRMFDHREADRIPLFEGPWGATLERWRREGLGDGDYIDYFGLDRIRQFGTDNSPRYPERTIEETDEYRIFTTKWGATMRDWKHQASVPEMIDVTVKNRDDWMDAKSRMTFKRDRVPWKQLEALWPRWEREGAWIYAGGWFGFDVTHAWFIGTERELIALIEDPEWCVDMWTTQQELSLSLLDAVWDAGYRFDGLKWPDDMGYKYSQFFSVDTYRELLKPIHRRAIEWAHEKGIRALLHSCGEISPFVEDLVGMGLDGLNPLEVKAGVDPKAIKQAHGSDLLLHGGFNALLWYDLEELEATIRRDLPTLMESGGYIFGSDHSTPSNVGVDDFQRIVSLVKELGTY